MSDDATFYAFYVIMLIAKWTSFTRLYMYLKTSPKPRVPGRGGEHTCTHMFMYADGVVGPFCRQELVQGAEKYRAAFYDSLVKTRELNAYGP